MRILGVHCDSPHDSGVAVLEDGRITFAVNEERLSRVKNDGGVPDKSLAEMKRSTGLALSDFDAIWHTGWTPARLLRNSGAYSRASYAMRRAGKWYGEPWMAVFKSPRNALGVKDYRINMKKHEKLMALLADYRGPIRHVSHHSCHAYAAYYAGGIPGSLTLVVEGVGDNKTTSWFLPGPKGLEEKQAQEWPHSVGRFYECVTKILGFNIVRHGGKITGLAAYGDPESKTYDKVRPMLRREGDRMLVSPLVYQLIRAWSKEGRKTPAYFEGASREDISAAFQRRLEEVVVEWVEHLVKSTGVRKISAGGGVFANVKMNQRIHEIPGVEEIMVHPGMSDVGLAVGAACAGWE
ncbi:MAG: hypothetical protein K8I02_03475, partial [Candidatus Methylomirabilis sp.]|nr:hypothetical protein [Deltaproteobacteria bacterium]